MFHEFNYNYTTEDLRLDYGEKRYISFGLINNRLCVCSLARETHHFDEESDDREQDSFNISADPEMMPPV